MNNVYYVGSGELTFDIIERIINVAIIWIRRLLLPTPLFTV